MPLVDTAAYLSSRTNKSFAERFLAKFELVSSHREKNGILGVWALPKESILKWRISILFDPEQGGMPVQVHWEVGEAVAKSEDPAGEVDTAYRTHTTVRTRWRDLAFKDDDKNSKCWVPQSFIRVDWYSKDEFTETSFCYLLREIDETQFPVPKDEDWRQPFAEMFERSQKCPRRLSLALVQLSSPEWDLLYHTLIDLWDRCWELPSLDDRTGWIRQFGLEGIVTQKKAGLSKTAKTGLVRYHPQTLLMIRYRNSPRPPLGKAAER